MNPFPLINGFTNQTVAYACGKCGTVCSPKIYACGPVEALQAAKDSAERCCVVPICQKCNERTVEQYRTICSTCRITDERKREHEAVAKAKKTPIAEYNGDLVFIDEEYVNVDSLEGDENGIAWACVAEIGLKLSAQDILESATDEMYEDAIEDLDVDSLQTVLDEWCSKQTICNWHQVNNEIVILEHQKDEWWAK